MSGRCICVCGVSLFESRVPLLQSVWLMLDQWCVAVHLASSRQSWSLPTQGNASNSAANQLT